LEELNTARRTVGSKITDPDERVIARLPESAWDISLRQDGLVPGGLLRREVDRSDHP